MKSGVLGAAGVAIKGRATRLLAKIELELSSPVIEAAWERAKAKGLETIVAETLRRIPSTGPQPESQ